jgi:hypothetical protein
VVFLTLFPLYGVKPILNKTNVLPSRVCEGDRGVRKKRMS